MSVMKRRASISTVAPDLEVVSRAVMGDAEAPVDRFVVLLERPSANEGYGFGLGTTQSGAKVITQLSPEREDENELRVADAVVAVNGIAVTRLHVHPIIATLSMMMIVQGGTMLLRPVAGGTIPAIVTDLVTGEVLGIYMPLVWAVLVLLLGWKLIHGSRFGLHLFAIGGGPEIARAFGIADRRNVLLAYIACSLFAALAGCFLAGRIASGDPNIGTPFALDSITAVALGGTQLAGGVGSLQGTVTGALIMALLANGMNLENLSAFIQTAVKGAILLVVVALQPRRFMGL